MRYVDWDFSTHAEKLVALLLVVTVLTILA